MEFMGPEIVQKALEDIARANNSKDPSKVDLDWILSYFMYQFSKFEDAFEISIRTAFCSTLSTSSKSHTNLLLQMNEFVQAIELVQPEWDDNTVLQSLYNKIMKSKHDTYIQISEQRQQTKLKVCTHCTCCKVF